jgi:hypothetical protein
LIKWIKRSSSGWSFTNLIFGAVLLSASAGAKADRNVLAPTGLIAIPNSIRFEAAVLGSNSHSNLDWITIGMPNQLLGLELEAERVERPGFRSNSFSAQYSLTGNAFSDLAPSLSVGVRDVLRQGPEGQALFVALTKTFGLSRAQERILRDYKVHVGYGTSRLDGPFIGIQGRFVAGFTAKAEYLSRHFNASVALPLVKNLNLKAYSLNGDFFYGAAFTIAK